MLEMSYMRKCHWSYKYLNNKSNSQQIITMTSRYRFNSWMFSTVQNFPQSKLDIFIPQTIDQGIQHGHKDGIKHRGHFPLVHGAHRWWLQVHECCRSIENSNSWDVGTACAEGFGPALLGVDLEDVGEDKNVGGKDS